MAGADEYFICTDSEDAREGENEDEAEMGPAMTKVETFDPFEDDTGAEVAQPATLGGTPPQPAPAAPDLVPAVCTAPATASVAPAQLPQEYPRVMCVPAYPVQVVCPIAGVASTPTTTPNCSPRPK